MKLKINRPALVAGGLGATLLGVTLAGCGGKSETTTTNTTSLEPTAATPRAASNDETDSTGGFENAAQTWGQIEMARAALDKVVMGKNLKPVHETAFKLRDLVKALPAQSLALPDNKRKSLQAHVTEVTQLVEMLDKAADANNVKSTHEHHAALNEALDMIKGLYPAEAFGSNMHMSGSNRNGGMSGNAMSDDQMGASGMSGGATNTQPMPKGQMAPMGGTPKPMSPQGGSGSMPSGGMSDDPPMSPAPAGGGMGGDM